jgi:hypothetical protein
MLAADLFASVGVDSYQPLLIADLIVGGMGVRERCPGQVLRAGRSAGLLWLGGERGGELAAGADAERGEDFPQVVDESAADADLPFRLAVPADSRVAAMRCAGPAAMLEPTAWVRVAGRAGRRTEEPLWQGRMTAMPVRRWR